ncbi:MAG TPA: anthranilate synthase component I [Opitutaceae bacterium]|jgi:anthranilate synthase component 1|nr:anthranilate synthase component I [Opitutaceae bacterium]
MILHPALPEFQRLAQHGSVIPVYADLMADFETPVSVYAKLRGEGPAYLLESVEGGENLYRYSFIGCRPRLVIASGPETTELRRPGRPPEIVPTPRDPLALVQAEIAGHVPVKLPGMPRFTGGAVGYIGYEYITRVEPSVPAAARDELRIPLTYFMLSDTLVIFDRVKQTLRLCVNARLPRGGAAAADAAAAYQEAAEAVRSLAAVLARPSRLSPAPVADVPAPPPPPGSFTRPAYEQLVEGLKEYIRAGDIIQVVPSQRFTKPFPHAPLSLYRALRSVNPSPYMFILEAGDFSLVGASPEVHVRLTDGLVEIRPIAGTRRRGATVAEDLELEKELLADEKERAEHLMLVDLARNDIGRVCDFGTVHVPERMVVERYSHVMHIVSQVEGRIASGKNAFDLMRATFPAGTVSGAPKIRAMQIIAASEPMQRGFYAGALGYFSYDGNLDSCITLRTGLIKDGQLHIQAGGGVVADSDPAAEYWETVNKASALLKAAEIAARISA